MNSIKVGPGQCLASIAKQHGFQNPATIYEHESNSMLRKHRPNMHVLQIGDTVVIPERTKKAIPVSTQGSMRFTVKGHITEFETVVEDFNGKPLDNMPYELEVGVNKIVGVTDSKGKLTSKIDASVKQGKLRIFLDGVKKNILSWNLEFGALPPHDSAIGIQARLNNLGYFCANEAGELDESTKAAIHAFKSEHGLPPTSKVDDAFLKALVNAYGF